LSSISRSILEEISTYVPAKSREDFIESRAHHIISSAIHLFTIIDEHFTPDEADMLRRRFLSSIQQGDPDKFARAVRRLKE
jgi:hypothetical protein